MLFTQALISARAISDWFAAEAGFDCIEVKRRAARHQGAWKRRLPSQRIR